MNHALFLSLVFASPLCAQNAYCVDTNLDILYSLDLLTGAVTNIGSTLNNGLATPADLCWRDDTNEIWTIDLSGGEAGTIDPATGTFTGVWNTGVSGWQGMAWDHTTQQFFVHNQNGQLSRLDPATGVLTLIGALAPAGPLVAAIEIDATGRGGFGVSTSPERSSSSTRTRACSRRLFRRRRSSTSRARRSTRKACGTRSARRPTRSTSSTRARASAR